MTTLTFPFGCEHCGRPVDADDADSQRFCDECDSEYCERCEGFEVRAKDGECYSPDCVSSRFAHD